MKAIKIKRKIRTGILLCLSTAGFSVARADDNQTFKLYAGVTHTETLPPVSTTLRPFVDENQPASGLITEQARNQQPPPVAAPPMQKVLPLQATLQQPQAPVQQPQPPALRYTVEWFMIPPWMAGAWLKDGDLTTQVTDLRTGRTSRLNEWTENRLQASWGHQIDPSGNIWHVNILPAERDGVSSGKAVRFLTIAQRCLKSDQQELVTSTHYVISESSAWSAQPFDTFQQESLNHYILNGADLLNSSSNRVFTYQGAPIREGHLESRFRKIAPFTATPTMNGIDLRASLRDFLQSQRLQSTR